MRSPRLLLSVLAIAALGGGTAIAADGGIGIGGDGGEEGGHTFPVKAKVAWGDGWGANRNHKGQDLLARCGKPLVAARAGRVKLRGNERSGWGHYIVIDGRKTNRDYLYSHLQARSPHRVGDRVRKGQRIGKVGESGNARGCHLHFELWKGDYNPRPDVTRKLKRWHRLTMRG